MFQEAALFPWLNVFRNVMFGLHRKPELSNRQRQAIAEYDLQLVGLEKYKQAYVHELSGGMKQRVALARSLAPDPRVLLMDEPLSALNTITREQLCYDIQDIWQRRHRPSSSSLSQCPRGSVPCRPRVPAVSEPGTNPQDPRSTAASAQTSTAPELSRIAAATHHGGVQRLPRLDARAVHIKRAPRCRDLFLCGCTRALAAGNDQRAMVTRSLPQPAMVAVIVRMLCG